jgi:site-specific recombinase XerD
MRGVPMKAVQELMGHRTMSMTMRYSHLSPDVRRDAVEALVPKSTTSCEPYANRAVR